MTFAVILVLFLFFCPGLTNSPYCDARNCGSNQTCCTLDNGGPGCCAGRNATCCGVQNLCCPTNTTCDPIQGKCLKVNNETFTCQTCTTVVSALVSKGCTAGCALLPPPFSLVCLAMVKMGLCDQILEWGKSMNPWKVCSSMGMCAAGTCSCGYCTRYVFGRCLELPPQHCPAAIQKRYAEFGMDKYFSKIPAYNNSVDLGLGFCFNGECNAEHEGCCLTCW